tara:strand:+ start:722 stop:877 length:156 start_codon:yes stop_codon:yes gene_type:complete
MHRIKWSDELEVGIEEVDHQHKTTIDFFNNVLEKAGTKQAEVLEREFNALL